MKLNKRGVIGKAITAWPVFILIILLSGIFLFLAVQSKLSNEDKDFFQSEKIFYDNLLLEKVEVDGINYLFFEKVVYLSKKFSDVGGKTDTEDFKKLESELQNMIKEVVLDKKDFCAGFRISLEQNGLGVIFFNYFLENKKESNPLLVRKNINSDLGNILERNYFYVNDNKFEVLEYSGECVDEVDSIIPIDSIIQRTGGRNG